jgi:hypothetical protein
MRGALGCVLLAVTACVMGVASPGPAARAADRPARQKWEYKVLDVAGLLDLVKGDAAFKKEENQVKRLALVVPLALNMLGEDGWELVLGGQAGTGLPPPGTYVFKRPK